MITNPHGGSRILKFKTDARALLALILAVAMLAGTTNFAAHASADSGRAPGAAEGAGHNLVAPAGAAAAFLPTATFSNNTAITIPGSGTGSGVGTAAAASPYPSNITVSGLAGSITDVNVTLTGFQHNDQGDVDILLVAPNGDKFMLLSDAGAFCSPCASANVTLDDEAAGFAPNNTGVAITTGSYKPTDRDGSTLNSAEDIAFPSPAPAQPYLDPGPTGGTDTLSTAFDGDGAEGTWSLYVVDDANTTAGSITGGWSITIETAVAAAATTTTVSGSPDPAFTDTNITFTANVTSTSTVNEGTVNFRLGSVGGSNLSCTSAQPRPVSSGVATCTIAASSLGEGTHTIFAVFNGTANFATSNGNDPQEVNNPTTVTGNEFCNNGAISIPSTVTNHPAVPYPSNIFVSGLGGTITKVTVELNGFTHTLPDEVDVMLVGPGGQKVLLMADAGGDADVSGLNLTFDDAAAATIPDAGPLSTNTYKPSDYFPADTFPAPAPAAPSPNTTLAVFNATAPNGTWKLFVIDDGVGETGSIANGWCLNFTLSSDPATTTTVSGSPNPSLTTQAVTFTSTTVKTSDSSPANAGTVTFKEGATNLTCTNGAQPRPVNASGQATCTVAAGALAEGTHTITADYSGSPGLFNLSSGTMTQTVDTQTTVNGNEFCNAGPITINSTGTSPVTATPYPSNITVSGIAGTISKVTVKLNGFGHQDPDDADVLLVGPGGQSLILMSDAGGDTDVSGLNFTFDDAAAPSLPDATVLSSGTFKPTNHAGGADAFPTAPAPTGTTLSVFTGDPNGTWKLYVTDDQSGSQSGQITGGWCVNITPRPNILVRDAQVAEPSTGSTNMVFTVVLSVASTQTVTVDYTHAPDSGGANPATMGTDYTASSGTVTFMPGERVKTINVPVLGADGQDPEPNETFLINLSNPVNGNITDGQAVGTITQGNTPGTVLISELRTSGPGTSGAGDPNDDYVEIYNNSDSPVTVTTTDDSTGWAVVASNNTCTGDPVIVGVIPNATVIPARGHYLLAGSGYSLANYGGAGAAAGNTPGLTTNINPDANVALFSTSNLINLSSINRLDAVGFGLNTGNLCDLLREGTTVNGAVGSIVQHAFVRRFTTSGASQDTNINANDFVLISTSAATINGTQSILGAPGPENLTSPRRNTAITTGIVNTGEPAFGTNNNNYNRDPTGVPNGATGTMSIRRTLTNPAGAPANITRIRIHIRDITTLNSPVVMTPPQAELRALTSADVAVTFTGGAPGTAVGITLEEPPTQALGGGLNASWNVPLPGPGLAPGATLGVNIRLGVQVAGNFRFAIIVEALP